MTMRLALFISGGGTNLQAIIDAAESGDLPAEIALVLSDREAFGLTRAEKAGIPTVTISSGDFDNREDFVAEFLDILGKHRVNFIALAGYLRKIPPELIREFRGRIVNIHPGPLPDFGGKGMYGMRVHEAVLEAGLSETEVTVHHVTEDYDEGEIIATEAVPVRPGDSPEELAARVLKHEHSLYPSVLAKFARKM